MLVIRALITKPPPRTQRNETASHTIRFAPMEPRRSGRVQNIPAPSYNVDQIFRGLEGEERVVKGWVGAKSKNEVVPSLNLYDLFL